jgi:hypothetical protein
MAHDPGRGAPDDSPFAQPGHQSTCSIWSNSYRKLDCLTKGIDWMDACNATVSASHVLSEQIGQQIFDALPEDGILVAIIGRDGTRWTSDPDAFARLGLDDATIAEFRARVDDGVEPVVMRVNDASIMMAQLHTEHTDCGYALVVLSRGTGKPVVPDISLLETCLGQMNLVARLTEENRQLMSLRMGYGASLGSPQWPTN